MEWVFEWEFRKRAWRAKRVKHSITELQAECFQIVLNHTIQPIDPLLQS